MFKVFQIPTGGFDHNFSYLVSAGNEALVIDPCGDVSKIRASLEKENAPHTAYILLTHAHPDHYDGLEELKTFFNAPLGTAFNSPLRGDLLLRDGMRLPLGNGSIEVLATPGHSRDSVCYRLSDDSSLFTGDTLFIGCCGFCRPAAMYDSLKRLCKLPGKLRIYPGHDYGDVPNDTLASQKENNPALMAPDLSAFREYIRVLT